MPDPNLLDALQALRDRYAQNLKTTGSLIAALKNATTALGKTARALAEMAESGAGGDSEKVGGAQRSLETIRFKETIGDVLLPDLRRDQRQLAAFVGLLRDAISALRAEQVDVVKLGKAHTALQKSRLQDPALSGLLPALAAELADAENRLGATFGEALRDALAERGIQIGGRAPHFEIGRFALDVDFVSRRAALNYGKERVAARLPLSVDGILKAYEHARKQITERQEDGGVWIRTLYDAWESALSRRQTNDLRANIVDCYFEMVLLRQNKAFRSAPSRHAFTDYSRAQFAFDLDQFLNRQRLEYKGSRPAAHVAIKAHTDDPARSLWVVDGDGPHDGRYIGDLVFAKE
ncbi:MAG: hypothetical protein IT323_19470 [Anaerolineae bacterium]|nr:hypothetical protein [Anaerolineae bacterium]